MSTMRASRGILLVVLLVVGGACVKRVEERIVTVEGDELRREDLMRPGTNLPAAFTAATAAASPRDCPAMLHDSIQQTTLTLRRALVIPVQDPAGATYQPFGDYAAQPPGKYGEQDGEGVRVDCVRLRGVGIVKLLNR